MGIYTSILYYETFMASKISFNQQYYTAVKQFAIFIFTDLNVPSTHFEPPKSFQGPTTNFEQNRSFPKTQKSNVEENLKKINQHAMRILNQIQSDFTTKVRKWMNEMMHQVKMLIV